MPCFFRICIVHATFRNMLHQVYSYNCHSFLFCVFKSWLYFKLQYIDIEIGEFDDHYMICRNLKTFKYVELIDISLSKIIIFYHLLEETPIIDKTKKHQFSC